MVRQKVIKGLEKEEAGITQIPNVHQNFGLTKIQFDTLCMELKSGNESVFERIFLGHFNDCILYLIKRFTASHDVAYDISMDTLIEFRQKILMDKIAYGNLRYLFTKMACNQYLKAVVKDQKLKEIYVEYEEEEIHFEDKLEALKRAWNTMPEEERDLLEKHYYLDIPLKAIAESTLTNDATLRKQKQRAVDKLRTIFFTIYK